MEYLILIILAVGISILDDRFRGKKKVPPPTTPQEIPRPRKRAEQNATFDIPPMRGVPKQTELSLDAEVLRAQELRAKWEEARHAAQREKQVREREERLAAAQAATNQLRSDPPAPPALLPQLTADTMKQAIVLSEILGKPRALQKFQRR